MIIRGSSLVNSKSGELLKTNTRSLKNAWRQFEETSYKNSALLIEAMVVGLLDVGAVGNLGVTSAAVGDVVPGKGGYEP